MAPHSLYPIATGSEDQAIELPDVAADDSQEIDGGEADKVNLVPTDDTATREKGANDSEAREKSTVVTDGGGGGAQGEETERARDAQEAAVPEKLQDDDKLQEIWYKRWFFKVFPQLKIGRWLCGCMWVGVMYQCDTEFLSCLVEERRQLRANDDVYNSQFKYIVSESKFSLNNNIFVVTPRMD